MSTSGFQVNRSAPAFYHRLVWHFMEPFVQELVRRGVRPTDDVLDVACGTGFAALAAEKLVAGNGGSVTGSDINPEMIAYATTHNSTVTWLEASALDMPFDDRSFDAVICQQGIQFFPDVIAGLQEMRRVLRPGGRMTATVWTPMQESPLLYEEAEMLVEYCNLDRAIIDSASATTGDELLLWVDAAGFRDIVVDSLEFTVGLPPLASYVPEHLRALPWAEPLFGLNDATRTAAIHQVLDRLDRYATGKGADVPFRTHIVSARA